MSDFFLERVVFYVFFGIGFVYIIRKFFTPPRMLETSKETTRGKLVNKLSDEAWCFVAMKYHSLILNRTYVVVVFEKYLLGLKTGKTIASPLYGTDSQWGDPMNYINPELEDKYKNINTEPENALSLDKANFLIKRSSVVRIEYFPHKWGMGNVPYSGRLVFVLNNDKKLELILLGNQDHELIMKRLQKK